MKINLHDLSELLSENNLGVYFVSEPLKKMPTQDGGALYEVNGVHLDNFLSQLTSFIESKSDDIDPK